MSSFISFVTSLSSTTASSAQPLWALVISWRIAVRNPCGLKNPVSQNTFGRPSNSQLVKCAWRSSRSVNQNPIVADSHEIWQTQMMNHETSRYVAMISYSLTLLRWLITAKKPTMIKLLFATRKLSARERCTITVAHRCLDSLASIRLGFTLLFKLFVNDCRIFNHPSLLWHWQFNVLTWH